MEYIVEVEVSEKVVGEGLCGACVAVVKVGKQANVILRDVGG